MGIDTIREPVQTIRAILSSLSLRKSHKRHTNSTQDRNPIAQNGDASISSITLVSNPSILDVTIDNFDEHVLLDYAPACHQLYEISYEGEYYNDFKSADDTICMVRVENKQFKVHRFILERDDSQFFKKAKMISEGKGFTKDTPVFTVSDTVDKFRDFLRVLYSLPKHLPRLEIDPNSIRKLPHLLNVAELAHKYSFTSFELWATEHIHSIIADSAFYIPSPGFSLGHSSTPGDLDPDSLVTRILEFSIQAKHSDIRDILLQKLMTRILWYDYSAGPKLIKFIEKYAPRHAVLCRLRGVVNYRRLVDLESSSSYQDPLWHKHTQPRFSSSMDVETRMKFLSAHHALTSIWDRLSSHPPPLPSAESYDARRAKYHAAPCSPHDKCLETWAGLWSKAFHRTDDVECHKHAPESSSSKSNSPTSSSFFSDSHSHLSTPPSGIQASSAAVLRKLKQTNMILRKETANSSDICVECSLGGLEALALIRDEVIDSLDDMFRYSPWHSRSRR